MVPVTFLLQEYRFFKFHIMGNFEALVGCIPELVSLGSQFVTDIDHFLALWLKFGSPLFQNVYPGLATKDL